MDTKAISGPRPSVIEQVQSIARALGLKRLKLDLKVQGKDVLFGGRVLKPGTVFRVVLVDCTGFSPGFKVFVENDSLRTTASELNHILEEHTALDAILFANPATGREQSFPMDVIQWKFLKTLVPLIDAFNEVRARSSTHRPLHIWAG